MGIISNIVHRLAGRQLVNDEQQPGAIISNVSHVIEDAGVDIDRFVGCYGEVSLSGLKYKLAFCSRKLPIMFFCPVHAHGLSALNHGDQSIESSNLRMRDIDVFTHNMNHIISFESAHIQLTRIKFWFPDHQTLVLAYQPGITTVEML